MKYFGGLEKTNIQLKKRARYSALVFCLRMRHDSRMHTFECRSAYKPYISVRASLSSSNEKISPGCKQGEMNFVRLYLRVHIRSGYAL